MQAVARWRLKLRAALVVAVGVVSVVAAGALTYFNFRRRRITECVPSGDRLRTFWTGVAAAVIGIYAAMLGIGIPEGVAGLGAGGDVALLSGSLAGWADFLNSGGAC